MLDEFYRVAFRKKLYASIEDLQNDLDLWIKTYNEDRPHQGRWCFGNPQPHKWTAKGEAILEKISRARAALDKVEAA